MILMMYLASSGETSLKSSTNHEAFRGRTACRGDFTEHSLNFGRQVLLTSDSRRPGMTVGRLVLSWQNFFVGHHCFRDCSQVAELAIGCSDFVVGFPR